MSRKEHNVQKILDRVRYNTAEKVNQQIDKKMENDIRYFSTQTREELSKRIEELDQEWDIERLLIVNASTLSLTGLVLGITKDKRFLAVPAVVLSFLWLHGVQGWCPPMPILRRMGVRTRQEIDREKFALKALRGDFESMLEPGAEEADKMPRAATVFEAVSD